MARPGRETAENICSRRTGVRIQRRAGRHTGPEEGSDKVHGNGLSESKQQEVHRRRRSERETSNAGGRDTSENKGVQNGIVQPVDAAESAQTCTEARRTPLF